MPVVFWLGLVYVAIALSLHALQMYRRKRDMPVLAKKFALRQWGDDSLPRDLYLNGTNIAPVRRIFNIFEGSVNGIPVAVFDVAKQAGKSTAYFTVIAARAPDPFGAEAFDPDLTTEIAGEWILIYRSRGAFSFIGRRLMSMQQIEDQLRSVGATQRVP